MKIKNTKTHLVLANVKTVKLKYIRQKEVKIENYHTATKNAVEIENKRK